MDEHEDYSRLPLEDRLQHRLWKARLQAYEEVTASLSPSNPSYLKEHSDTVRRAVLSESNAAAQEAAFAMLLRYIHSCPSPDVAIRLRSQVIEPVIERGLAAGKTGTRTKTFNILSAFISADTSAEPVISELLNAANASMKQPKQLAAILQCITELIKGFGGGVTGCGRDNKRLHLTLSSAFQHADKTVRQEATNLVVEASRWAPNADLPSLISGLKTVQIKELAETISYADRSCQPTMWLRGQKKSPPVEDECSLNNDVNMENNFCKADKPQFHDSNDGAYESAAPVNVLEHLPPNFVELVESAKWKERKEALDALLPLLEVPKIEDGRYGELVGILVKRVADVNIAVSIVAVHCLQGLARGLRSSFAPHRSEVIGALLDRCKEKKANVLQAARDALDACLFCILSISDITSELQTAIYAKSPQVRQEVLSLSAKVLRRHPPKLPLFMRDSSFKEFVKLVAGELEDAEAKIRDSACETMAVLWSSLGEAAILPFLEKTEKSKIAKIKEMTSGCSTSSNVAVIDHSGHTTNGNIRQASTAVPTKRPNERSSSNLANKNTVAAPAAAAANPQTKLERKKEDNFKVNANISDEAALEAATDVFGAELIAKLSSNLWKERLEAMDGIVAECTKMQSDLFVKFLSKYPGWKESNFQVFLKMLQTIQKISPTLNREAVVVIVDGVIDKLSDAKLQKETSALLLSCCKVSSIGFLFHHIIRAIATQKSPKVLSDLCKFMSSTMMEYGTVSINIEEVVDFVKMLLTNPNSAVRTSAVQVAVTLYSFLGAPIRSMFSDQSAAILSIIDSEFGKTERAQEPVGLAIGNEVAANANVPVNSYKSPPAPKEDSVLRPDLSHPISSIILPKLLDPNWKVRKEGLDELFDTLQKSSNRMSLDTSVLPEFLAALKARFNDTNKNLVIQALELAGHSLQAIGNRQLVSEKPACRALCQSAMQCLADNKPQVRQAALKCLDDMFSVLQTAMIFGVAGSCIVACDSPNLRKELIGWLVKPFGSPVNQIDEESINCIFVALLTSLQDRSGEVRRAVHTVIPMIQPGEMLVKFVQKNNPSLLLTIQPLLNAGNNGGQGSTLAVPKTPVKTKSQNDIGPAPTLFFLSNNNGPTIRNIKWPFDGQSAPRKDQIDSLEQLSKDLFTQQAVVLLYSSDFREQIAGMGLLEREFEDSTGNLGHQLMVKLQSSIDVILRYLTIRLFDSNTSVLLKCLDILELVLGAMDRGNIRLAEPDAQAFLPFFIHRLGEWREGPQQRQRVKSILRLLCRVYPASKLFNHLAEWGLKAKSSKTRSETLDELGVLLSRNGCPVISPPKHLPLIAGCVADRDGGVRSSALNVLVQLSRLLGQDSIYKMLSDGVISQKDMDLFEERLKRCSTSTSIDGVDVDMEGDKEDAQMPPPTPLLHDITYNEEINCDDEKMSDNGNATPTIPLFRPILRNTSNRAAGRLQLDHHPLDTEVELIGCSSDSQCIQALQRLDEHLNNPREHLIDRADQLIMALSIRLRAINMEPMAAADTCQTKSRLCRYVCNALVLLISNVDCIQRMSEETLESLISTTLHSLLSPNINENFVEDKDQLLKALNVLLVKALEGCHPNECFRVLLLLLLDAFINTNLAPSGESKYPELIMKCLWKETKSLEKTETMQQLSVDQLFADIDRFFHGISPIEWKTRAAKKMPFEDLPLRTVKTIIHELVSKMGASVCKHWTLISADSFVISYCRQFMETLGIPAEGKSPDGRHGGDGARDTMNSAASGDNKLNEFELESRLKTICECICSKPDTRMGLLELHELKTQHGWYAEEQIKLFVASLGPFFQKYIERGLSRIDAELSSAKPEALSSSSKAASMPSTIEEYKERLASLKSQMFGCEVEGVSGDAISYNTDNDTDHLATNNSSDQSPVRNRLESPAAKFARFSANSSNSANPSAPNSPLSNKKNQFNTFSTDSTITSLRERLARLKNQEGTK